MYFKMHGCSVGSRLKCKSFPTMRRIPNKNIVLGNNVMIGSRVALDVADKGMLVVGNNVNMTQDIIISCGSKIEIGEYSGIGEYSSIRDGEHGFAASRIIHQQEAKYRPITIGRDVQISRGCTVLGGASLLDGAVLGANCIAGSGFTAVENGIYFGIPPKLIAKRG